MGHKIVKASSYSASYNRDSTFHAHRIEIEAYDSITKVVDWPNSVILDLVKTNYYLLLKNLSVIEAESVKIMPPIDLAKWGDDKDTNLEVASEEVINGTKAVCFAGEILCTPYKDKIMRDIL